MRWLPIFLGFASVASGLCEHLGKTIAFVAGMLRAAAMEAFVVPSNEATTTSG